MDWKLLSSTFVLIFLAQLGDRTQLATLSLASGTSSRWTVFAGFALRALLDRRHDNGADFWATS
jgi:putative Ca2+/H+ antiporter (TMEM165/GDT1 family)